MRSLGVVGLALAGCYAPRPAPGAPCSPDGDCPAPYTCMNAVCVDDGEPDAVGVDAAADADVPDGASYPVVPYLPGDLQSPGTASWMVTESIQIDTTTLAITPPQPGIEVESVAQLEEDARSLAVIRIDSLSIAPGTLVRVTGDRPLAILARTDIVVAGVLDASARANVPGPGGGDSLGAGGDGVASAMLEDSGGGGGGNGTAGARGGDAAAVVDGGAGGAAMPATALRGGGSGGMHSVRVPCDTVTGGGGGGALLLVAFGAFRIEGRVEVNGGGGQSGPTCPASSLSGTGGGAGGSLVIMARTVTVAGAAFLTANGGGGGAGSTIAGAGVPGDDGHDDATIAAAGMPAGPSAGQGGTGGANMTLPGPGMDAINAGGGGGAVGRIVVRLPDGIAPIVPASPPATIERY